MLQVHHTEHHTHDLANEPTLLTPPRNAQHSSTSSSNGRPNTAESVIDSNAQLNNQASPTTSNADHELDNVVSSSSNGSAAPAANGIKKASVKKKYEPLADDVENQRDSRSATGETAGASTTGRRPTRSRIERSLVIDRFYLVSARPITHFLQIVNVKLSIYFTCFVVD